MACCSEFKTECLKVITIGYLKDFIGTNIHSSTNDSPLSVNYSDNTYCPTYSELTSGTLIQNWQEGETPNGDRDGIEIGGSYAGNQLVNQQDLSMKYTRFKTFTLTHSNGIISECGGNITIGYNHEYTRYTKNMNGTCEINSVNATVTDTKDNEVNLSADCSWVHPQIGTSTVDAQPKSRTASARSCTVNGSVVFRGTSHTSDFSVSQNALTGSYSNLEGRHYTGVTSRATTSTSFGCDGGTYSNTGTGSYYDRYEWVDSCGNIYHSSPYNDVNGTESAGSKSGTFSKVYCPTESYSTSDTLTISYHGYTSSDVFTQSCSQSCGECQDYTVWDEYDCDEHPGETITVNGTAYTCSYVDGECTCTSASTSMTVECPGEASCSIDITSGSEDLPSSGGSITFEAIIT